MNLIYDFNNDDIPLKQIVVNISHLMEDSLPEVMKKSKFVFQPFLWWKTQRKNILFT